jgi:hypothetical protein
MTHPSLCALREGTRRLLSTLLVCVGAVALMQAAAWPSPDDAGRVLASPSTFAPAAGQLALTAGTVAEDPPDNDDDGDDDVIGSAAVLPERPSAGAVTRAQFLTLPDVRFARQQIARCRALRAPPR